LLFNGRVCRVHLWADSYVFKRKELFLKEEKMKKIALIYHSGYGHTAYFAKHVAEGIQSVSGANLTVLTTEEATKQIDSLSNYDGFIFGTPTYMGSASGAFKMFMESTSPIFMKQAWKGKLSAGFTVSGSASGDKLNTLMSLVVFAGQHGLLWMGNPMHDETNQGVAPDQAVNRLGSYIGAMAQAGNVAPDKAFVAGDLKTAHLFGANFAKQLLLQTPV
jgi:NAD(P)H dehydrogenase (quinone)